MQEQDVSSAGGKFQGLRDAHACLIGSVLLFLYVRIYAQSETCSLDARSKQEEDSIKNTRGHFVRTDFID